MRHKKHKALTKDTVSDKKQVINTAVQNKVYDNQVKWNSYDVYNKKCRVGDQRFSFNIVVSQNKDFSKNPALLLLITFIQTGGENFIKNNFKPADQFMLSL